MRVPRFRASAMAALLAVLLVAALPTQAPAQILKRLSAWSRARCKSPMMILKSAR